MDGNKISALNAYGAYAHTRMTAGQYSNGLEFVCPGHRGYSSVPKFFSGNIVCCVPFQALEWRPIDVSKSLVRRRK